MATDDQVCRRFATLVTSLDFDWSEISPTIFGAVFESTINPETQRSGGVHYTSIENFHKVIDPLFSKTCAMNSMISWPRRSPTVAVAALFTLYSRMTEKTNN